MNRRALARPSRDAEVRTWRASPGEEGLVTIGSFRRRRSCGRAPWLLIAFIALGGLTLTAGAAARGTALSPGEISNGTLRLGVNPEGHLDAVVEPGSVLGLVYVPTGADALIHGCWCEGWGVADRTSGLSGWASVANGGISPNLAVRAFDLSAGTADSTVEIGGRLRVRHVFRPSPRPELYQVDLTVENLGATAADLVYRRAVDWDVPPTRFEEFVTIRGAHPRLLAATDHGFQDVNPFVPLSNLGGIGTFEDLGPGDRGSVFDFTLGVLAPGERTTMTMFFGAAATEADAVAALGAVDAEIFSLGQPSTPDGPTLGTPNTFMFGVTDGAVATGPMIVRGRLMPTRGGGVVNGSVGLYLPSLSDAPSEDALVATATTSSDGTFTLETPLTPALSAAAAATDGQINLDLVGNVNGTTYHLAIVRAYVGGAWVDELGNAPTQLALTPVSGVVNPRLIPNSAGGATSGSQAYGFCVTYRFPIASARAWTTVGELHTPADTELATFTYGRKADSYISKAFSLDGFIWFVKGSVRVANETGSSGSATIAFSTPADMWAREIQTEFVYTKYRTELWCSSPAAVLVSRGYEIRATKWVGSSRLGADLQHLDNRCTEDHGQYIATHPRGARFTRDESKYATFPNAASVAVGGTSVSLSARSGMSQWVTLEWKFGLKFPEHVLCGTDDYPPEASRIFAGA